MEDFAGNTGTCDARYVNGDLSAAMDEQVRASIVSLTPAKRAQTSVSYEEDNITRAIQILNQGFGQAQPSYVASPFGTPTFLGGAEAAERAMAEVDAAIEVANDPTREAIYAEQAQMVSRAAWSDLMLYHEWIETLRPAFGKELYIQDSYESDMERVSDGLTAMEYDRQDGCSPVEGRCCFPKMAHQLWIMNWNAQPQPWNIANVSRDNELCRVFPGATFSQPSKENSASTYRPCKIRRQSCVFRPFATS